MFRLARCGAWVGNNKSKHTGWTSVPKQSPWPSWVHIGNHFHFNFWPVLPGRHYKSKDRALIGLVVILPGGFWLRIHVITLPLDLEKAFVTGYLVSAHSPSHQALSPSTSHQSSSAGFSNHQLAPGFGRSLAYFLRQPPSNI